MKNNVELAQGRSKIAGAIFQALSGHVHLSELAAFIDEGPGSEPEGDSRLCVVEGVHGSGGAFITEMMTVLTGLDICFVAADENRASEILADLAAVCPERKVFLFPGWTVPDLGSNIGEVSLLPSREETETRIARLGSILFRDSSTIPEPTITICSKSSLESTTMPPAELRESCILLVRGNSLARDFIIKHLVALGFTRVNLVQEYGDFSVRGGIVDFFTPGVPNPVRLELFGDEIESIRLFEPETQRSTGEIERVRLLPAREMVIESSRLAIVSDEGELSGWERFFSEGYFEGAERRFNEYYPERATILDYFDPSSSLLVFENPENLPDIEPKTPFLGNLEELATKQFPVVLYTAEETGEAILHDLKEASGTRDGGKASCPPKLFNAGFSALPSVPGFMAEVDKAVSSLIQQGLAVHIFCGTASQLRRYRSGLGETSLSALLGEGDLGRGFISKDTGIAVFSDREIFRKRSPRRKGRRFRGGQYLSDPFALEPGDYVVHIDHGVGIFFGLRRLLIDNRQIDCLELRYKGDGKLFVPVDQLQLVQKYRSGDDGNPVRLDKLGGKAWGKLKARTRKALKDITSDLIELYASRSVSSGHGFGTDTSWQDDLEAAFIFEETPDQIKAIRDVKKDMESNKPMDRLICGDVGFGKTEVAVRAAFKCVTEGKQVCILVPTTVLAQQHFSTFRDRLAPFPVKVEMLSRFRSPAEQRAVIAGLVAGSVDIIIGTHRLLSKDVVFSDLGLLIIDEEQRFGVGSKEKIKALKENVDVLAMTATPIPRTMHMALSGIRDLSILATPPENRHPIRTIIAEFNEKTIRDTIMKEIDRGGQVYFVHNRVKSIGAMASFLEDLLPGVSIGVAHGQMPEKRLESVMLRFLNREFDLLLSTLIIEAGIDIPSVNTMVVNRADMFGLSQLYQLRGRIGRSAVHATAVLLVPPRKKLKRKALHRLRVIRDYTDLGSGYAVAMHDLEIRGAGNVLGAEQHGFIASVGFETYCKLLEEAVSEIKGVREEIPLEPELNIMGADAFIPETYIDDSSERMTIYRKINSLVGVSAVSGLLEELSDRFGPVPREVQSLSEIKLVRIQAAKLGIEKISAGDKGLELTFRLGYHPSPGSLGVLTRRYPGLSFRGSDPFGISLKIRGVDDVLSFIGKFIDTLLQAGNDGSDDFDGGSRRMRR